ncbi:MAG: hypothetical protein ABF239_04100 [Wenyingzhuangia sp.]
MKKFLFFIILGTSSFVFFAQEKDPELSPIKVEIVKNSSFENAKAYGKHEISIDFFSALVVPAISVSYEKILNIGNSVGVNLFTTLGSYDNDYNFSVGPYYRLYFLNRKDYGSKGFFVEGFSYLTSLDVRDDYSNYNSYENSYAMVFSLGAAVGKKWISRKGFTAEYLLGFGRYFIDPNEVGQDSLLKFSISVGKRF